MAETKLKTKARILVVDDEPNARSGLEKLLRQDGYEVDVADDGVAALAIAGDRPPDLVVTDLKMPRMDGVELLKHLRAQDVDLPVLMVTAFGDVSSAVKAMRAGAEDYLTKPVDFDALSLAIERSLARRDLKVEAENLRRQLRERDGEGVEGLIGASPAMQKVYRLARQVAAARATVLVTGESGTGKGELARAIHKRARAPPRRSSPSTAPRSPSRSSRASSSATRRARSPAPIAAASAASSRPTAAPSSSTRSARSPGYAGEAAPRAPGALLRARRRQRDGRGRRAPDRRDQPRPRRGRAPGPLPRGPLLPPQRRPHRDAALRLRGSDVLVLADHFLRRFTQENKKRIEGFDDDARAKIVAHRWPGNVRELENAIERAVVLSEGTLIVGDDLPIDVAPAPKNSLRVPGATMAELERYAILTTLEATNGSTTKAAEMLDISVRTIQYRLHEYGLAGKTAARPRGGMSESKE